MAQLPPPIFLGSTKPNGVSKPQHDPIHIQIPCALSRYNNQSLQWELIDPQAVIQLVNSTKNGVNEEIIRVLDLQNMPILFQPLNALQWSQLNDIAYELDLMQNNDIVGVYAIKFNSEQDAERFNQVFKEINKRNAVALYQFLQPLTDAIRRGDVKDACTRFRFLCDFEDKDRNIVVRAEEPLTLEEIELQKSVTVPISVENCDGSQCEISLRVPKDSTIADLREIMYLKYEIPKEVQKWLDEQSLLKNSEPILDKVGESRKIYLYILNAAKVGLNREEFMKKLELYKINLQKKQIPAQLQTPMHEEEVQKVVPPTEGARFADPVGPYPGDLPPGQPIDQAMPTNPYQEEPQPEAFVPGTLWSCPNCRHVNAWENIKCEKCRGERPNELPK